MDAMNRFTVLEAHVAQHPGSLSDLERRGLVAELRGAAVAIDALWRAAFAEGKDRTAAELREASDAVHRVLEGLPTS